MNFDNQTLLRYGLKWNPFSPEVPVSALWQPPNLEQFCWRMQTQVREGGFALITGEPGTGKSVALRALAHQLSTIPDIRVAALTRPQSNIQDFYRELGNLFGLALAPHNRWGGFKLLREIWLNQVEATRLRPVILIDEAQQMPASVLAELRILCSCDFDSRAIATIVLCGDQRLIQQFRSQELLPIASRIRVKLILQQLDPSDLHDWLTHALAHAGAPQLITPEVMNSLAELSVGNLRVLTNTANDLLAAAARNNLPQIDQKLYLETFNPIRKRNGAKAAQQ